MENLNEDECNEVEEVDEAIEEVNVAGSVDFNFEDFSMFIEKSVSQESLDVKDVDLKNYLLAYEQLYNFFVLLGRAFQFVASDVKSKIKILNTYYEDEINQDKKSINFSTVKSMVNYEKNSGVLKNSKYVSGSRTLLRLHRGLDFVRKFLREIYNAGPDSNLSGIARETYDQTLALHHTWIVKNAARLAMQFLPTRAELLDKISKSDEKKLNLVMEMFPNSLECMNAAYDRVQVIYTDNEILNLP